MDTDTALMYINLVIMAVGVLILMIIGDYMERKK